jgi:hypothetical protein
MSLADAAARYGPCSVCKPPVLLKAEAPAVASPQTPSAAPAMAPPSSAAPVVSGRCQATTKKGTQCSRRPRAGTRYCWQHGG